AIAILIVILLSSIRIRFKFDENEKYLNISFMMIGFGIDFTTMTTRLLVFNKFGLKVSPIIINPPKRIMQKSIKKRFKLSDFDFGYLKHLKFFIGKIEIENLLINIHGGILDPFNTGRIYGYYWAIKGFFPKLMSHINFSPSFLTTKTKVDGYGAIGIKLYYIVVLFIKLMADIISKKKKQKVVINKQGVNYA
ncbi:MAG: DUF2953 domain-containing protein, partial [Candidatus Zixiibacteriota bacterium]